jgi:chemotaxis response regulator CheB
MNKPNKSNFALIAIAGSVGGINAMQEILSCLPADFPVPIMYLQHLSRSYISHLDEVLQRSTALKVCWAQQGERPRAGVVYLCPPACSFIIGFDMKIALIPMKTTHDRLRPATRFFSSVARSYTHRAVAIVLSGAGSDGSEGVREIKANHGTVLVQNEMSSTIWGMPQSAIKTGCVDSVLAMKNIAPKLLNLVNYEKSSIRTFGGGDYTKAMI